MCNPSRTAVKDTMSSASGGEILVGALAPLLSTAKQQGEKQQEGKHAQAHVHPSATPAPPSAHWAYGTWILSRPLSSRRIRDCLACTVETTAL